MSRNTAPTAWEPTKLADALICHFGDHPLCCDAAKMIRDLAGQRDALLEAAEKVIRGLHARIDVASLEGGAIPVFDGIADLHAAIWKAGGQA